MSDYDPLEKWEAAARSARAMEFHFAADCLGEAIETVKALHQPRIVTTLEELHALPDGSVIRTSVGDIAEINYEQSNIWRAGFITGVEFPVTITPSGLPATVIYVPEES